MKRILLSLFVVGYLILGTQALRAEAGPFNVGDRVDVTIAGGGKGTIIDVGHGVPYEGQYKVHFDVLHHYDAKDGMWVNPRYNAMKRLGNDGEPVVEAPVAPANGQPPHIGKPHRENSPPPNTTAVPPKDNARPGSQEADFKKLTRARYHSAHGVTMDVEFHTFQIQGQRQYEHVYAVRGHFYNAWPVITTYKVTEHYQGEDMVREYDGKYWCFKDVHGEWLAVQAGEMKISAAQYIKR